MRHKKTEGGFCLKGRGFLTVFLIARFRCQMAEFPLPVLQIWRSRKRVAIQTQLMNIHVSECIYILLFTFGPQIWRFGRSPKLAAAPNCSDRDAQHRPSTWNATRVKRGVETIHFAQFWWKISTARVLIDAVGLCLLRVSEVWRLFAPDLRRWINSFSGSDFKPRLVYKTWYFCYFFTNFDQQF